MSQRRFSQDGEPTDTYVRRGDGVREWLTVLLPPLAIVGLLAGFFLLWQAMRTPAPMSASISPMQIASDYSVSPVSFTSSASPEPMRVIVLTPIPTSTPQPIIWQTATAEARLTATATWMPQPCPITRAEIDAMAPGTLCRQPTETPIPPPTSTPFLGCDPENWLPGELCEIGAPFAPTPTPVATVTAESER